MGSSFFLAGYWAFLSAFLSAFSLGAYYYYFSPSFFYYYGCCCYFYFPSPLGGAWVPPLAFFYSATTGMVTLAFWGKEDLGSLWASKNEEI